MQVNMVSEYMGRNLGHISITIVSVFPHIAHSLCPMNQCFRMCFLGSGPTPGILLVSTPSIDCWYILPFIPWDAAKSVFQQRKEESVLHRLKLLEKSSK